MKRFHLVVLTLFALVWMSGCSTPQPRHTDNICSILDEYPDWYTYAKNSEERWGTPIHIQMAFVYQESRFVDDARPARQYLLGVIPWFRPSSAYGYAQAQDPVWKEYKAEAAMMGADRDEMDDALDFIGWYNDKSYQRLGLKKWDAKRLYLAYHEGHGGYKRKTYLKKPWLIKISKKVANQSWRFKKQLAQCEHRFKRKSWFNIFG